MTGRLTAASLTVLAWTAGALVAGTPAAEAAIDRFDLSLPSSVFLGPEPSVAADAQGNSYYVWIGSDGSNSVVRARVRSANGTLGDTQTLSDPGQNAREPQVLVDGQGNAHYVWRRWDGSKDVAQTRVRSAGGTLADVQPLSTSGLGVESVRVALDAQGAAYYAWNVVGTTVQSRVRSANGTLSEVQDISTPGQTATFPGVTVDGQGKAYYTWTRYDGSSYIVQTRLRFADGTFTDPQSLSDQGQSASNPKVAVDGQGTAQYIWSRFEGSNSIVQARTRPADGTLGTIRNLTASGRDVGDPDIAVDAQGNAHYTWQRVDDGSNNIAQTRVLAANGTLGDTQDLSAPGGNAYEPQLALDSQGNAHYVWSREVGTAATVQTRVRSAGGTLGPTQDLSAAGVNAASARMVVDARLDTHFVWARFDDSSSTVQGAIESTRGTDATGPTGPAGPTTQDGSSVAVGQPGGGGQQNPSNTTARDTLAPAITAAKLSASRFAVDTRGRASAKAKRGTTLSLRLSEASTVSFVVELRKGKRWRKVRTFGRSLPAGKNTVKFSGMIRVRGKGRALKPGRYRLRVRPNDRAGNKGKVSTIGFTIVKG